MRPGQPEPCPALGSADRGCRRAGCGSRQRRRRRATAAAVTGKIVQGERRTTEKVVAHAGKPGGSEDAAAQAQRRRPWRPRSGTRAQALESERERSERARGSSGARLSLQEGAGDATGQPRGKRSATMAGALCAWRPRPGHAPPIGAFYRARGGQQCRQGGEPIWAICRPNLDMGPKAKLQPT